MTPGCRVANWVQSRPFRGSSTTVFSSTVALTAEVEVSTSANEALTCTSCASCPTFILKSRACSPPTFSTNPFCVTGPNPVAETVTSYVPGARFGAKNSPSVFVSTSRTSAVAGFLMDTFAPTMGAPDSSDTTPDRLAPASCAFIGIAEITSAMINTNTPTVTDQRLSLFILISQASLSRMTTNDPILLRNRARRRLKRHLQTRGPDILDFGVETI